MKVNDIFTSVQDELSVVGENIKKAAEVEFPQNAEIFSCILNNTGKGIRPAIVLLSAKIFCEKCDELIISMATGVELLHIATLVHDDIVDDASLRRGTLSMHKVWGSNLAMLAGDYLFAKAAEFICAAGNLAAIKLFTKTLMKITEGELYETITAYNPQRTCQDYFNIISAKTASLFSAAAQVSAILTEASCEKIEALRSYGYNLGMAFQIKDDILDFISSEEEVGKPVKKDLPAGNLTLPAILFLEQYPDSNFIKDALMKRNKESLCRAIDVICDSRAIEDSWAIAGDFVKKACEKIKIFPDNTSRRALIKLGEYIMEKT